METEHPRVSKKTWKREVSALIFCIFFYIVYTDNVPMAEILVWPVFTFGALAFGLDWWGKGGSIHSPYTNKTQGSYPYGPTPARYPTAGPVFTGGSPVGPYGGWDERSGQRPYWEGEYADYRFESEPFVRGQFKTSRQGKPRDT